MKAIYNATGAIDRLREALDDAEEELTQAVWTVPPPGGRTFPVTPTDVNLAVGAMRDATLAARAAVGGPEVTDEDVAETAELIRVHAERGRPLTRLLLEHDRARVAARTAPASDTAGDTA